MPRERRPREHESPVMASDMEGEDNGVPYGLLMWGQAGIYNGVDDRMVITALSDSVVGVVRPTRITAGSGLNVNVRAGWLAIASADDGTNCVVGSRQTHTVAVPAGGGSARTDHVWIDARPDDGRWEMRIVPQGSTLQRHGVSIGRITVPAGANLATQFTYSSLVPTLGRHADATSIRNTTRDLMRLTPHYPIAPYQIKPGRTFVVRAWGDGYIGNQLSPIRFRCAYVTSPILRLRTRGLTTPHERFDWEASATYIVNPTADSFRTKISATVSFTGVTNPQEGELITQRTITGVRVAWGAPHLGVNPDWNSIQVQGGFYLATPGQVITGHGSTFETYEPYLD